MPDYRRLRVPGGTYFFTVNLLERRSDLLVRHIDALREAVQRTRRERPFRIDAWVVLPEYFHCILTLPEADDDFSNRIKAIKIRFVRALPATERRSPVRVARGERGERGQIPLPDPHPSQTSNETASAVSSFLWVAGKCWGGGPRRPVTSVGGFDGGSPFGHSPHAEHEPRGGGGRGSLAWADDDRPCPLLGRMADSSTGIRPRTYRSFTRAAMAATWANMRGTSHLSKSTLTWTISLRTPSISF